MAHGAKRGARFKINVGMQTDADKCRLDSSVIPKNIGINLFCFPMHFFIPNEVKYYSQ